MKNAEGFARSQESRGELQVIRADRREILSAPEKQQTLTSTSHAMGQTLR